MPKPFSTAEVPDHPLTLAEAADSFGLSRETVASIRTFVSAASPGSSTRRAKGPRIPLVPIAADAISLSRSPFQQSVSLVNLLTLLGGKSPQFWPKLGNFVGVVLHDECAVGRPDLIARSAFGNP